MQRDNKDTLQYGSRRVRRRAPQDNDVSLSRIDSNFEECRNGRGLRLMSPEEIHLNLRQSGLTCGRCARTKRVPARIACAKRNTRGKIDELSMSVCGRKSSGKQAAELHD